MSDATSTLDLEVVKAGQGKEAFERVKADLLAVPSDQVSVPRVDLQTAATIAYSVATRDQQAERRERLQPLIVAGLLDEATIQRLPWLCLAAWYARRKQLITAGSRSNATVDPTIIRRAYDLRGRMLKVLEYHLGEETRWVERLAAIRSGAGHQDLASDAADLADIYRDPSVKAQLEGDQRHYDAADADAADELAQAIFAGLGLQDAEASWTDLSHRAWTLLQRDYETLASAGRLVFRDAEDVAVTYPSLVAASRSTSVRRRVGEAAQQAAALEAGKASGADAE